METTNNEEKIQKTELAWDKYMNYLIFEIRQSKFMKRAKDKPMFAASHEQEPHRTTRLEHQEMTAHIAKKIAKALNLNHEFIEAAMLMHDAGHPFSAHDGEEMFNGEAIINNTQYFHHNAEGVKVIKAEHICEKAIARIPNIESMPELKQELIDEFPYFLDVVISHDGEATPSEMYKKPEEYPDIKTAVDEKLKMATSNSGNYKFTAQTPEGQIAKFADVIAYLATDIQDRFRSGIHDDFPREYLVLLGEILADSYITGGDEEKIQIARNKIEAIEKSYIEQTVYSTEENKALIEKSEKIAQKILNENKDTILNIEQSSQSTDEEDLKEETNINNEKIIEAAVEEALKDETNIKYYESVKLKKLVANIIHARSEVIKTITNKMQEYFIDDLIKNSVNSSYIHFSKPVEDVFFKAKILNYTYLPQAKWHYLDEGQPEAVHGLVHFLSTSLRRTGVIANFFNDESVRKQLQDCPDALLFMQSIDFDRNFDDDRQNQKYEEFKKTYNVKDIRMTNKKFKGGDKEEILALKELFAAAYTYTQDSESTFVQQYLNTYYAIEDQVRCKVDTILGRVSDKTRKSRKTHIEFYDNMIEEDLKELKSYIEEEYGQIKNITDEDREKIISDITLFQRLFIEDKMAKQIAITYLSGLNDKSFNKLAQDTGLMKKENVFDEERRGGDATKLHGLGKAMTAEITKHDDEGR